MLHRDKVQTFDFIKIEDSANVRMIQRRSQPRFPIESFEICLFRGQLRRQHFEHHGAAQFGVGRFIDRALSAGADFMGDFVVAEGLPDHAWRYLTPNLAELQRLRV